MYLTGLNSDYAFDLEITPGKANKDCEGTLIVGMSPVGVPLSGCLEFQPPLHFYAHSPDEIESWARDLIHHFPERKLIFPENRA